MLILAGLFVLAISVIALIVIDIKIKPGANKTFKMFLLETLILCLAVIITIGIISQAIKAASIIMCIITGLIMLVWIIHIIKLTKIKAKK